MTKIKQKIKDKIENFFGIDIEENIEMTKGINIEKELQKDLQLLRKIQREKSHPLIHKIHKEHKISKRTLLYVKEYGKSKNVTKTILKESIKILLLASLISSFGGLALENIKMAFITIIPLIILLPVLNNMIGSYGTVVSSRFSTIIHTEGKIKKWYKNKELMTLIPQAIFISLIIAIIGAIIAIIISNFSGFGLDATIIFKIMAICIINVLLIVSIIFFISIFAGTYFYKKGEDPDNFLIPITTSIADFGNMLMLTLLIVILF